MLSQDLPADPKLLPACIWVVDVRGFTVSNPTLYTLMVSIGVIHYDCSVGYTGAFVPVAYASPCPSFNRGKIAPGGGRGSRSPPRAFILPRPIDDEPSRMPSNLLSGAVLFYISLAVSIRPPLYIPLSDRTVPCRCRLPLTPRRCLKAARYRLASLAIPSPCIFHHLLSPVLACSES